MSVRQEEQETRPGSRESAARWPLALWASISALLLLPLLFYWRLFTPNLLDRGSIPHGDFAVQFYAFAHYQAERLLAGQVPLWCPGAYSGFPFLADVQSAVFYPPRLLTIVISSPWGFPYLALEAEAALHLALAGLFMFLLGRRLFGRTSVALLAALTFAFSSYLTSFPVQQLAILESAVWLPLLLLCLDLAACERRWLNRWTLLAGLALGMSALAGHPQTVMLVGYAGIAYGLWRRPRWSGLAMIALVVALALAIAAVQLLPAAEYMLASVRASSNYDQMSSGLPITDVVQVLLPGSVSGDSPLYLGILPLLLIGAALLLRPVREVRFWAFVALVALLLSFGNEAFVHSLFYLFVPGWRLFRNQERDLLLVVFPLSLLVGYGAQALMAKEVSQAKKQSFARGARWLLWLLLAAVALFFLGLLKDGWQPNSPFYWLLASAVYASILAFFGWALLRWQGSGQASAAGFAGLAIALLLFDLFTVGWRHNLTAQPPEANQAMPAAVAAIKADAAMHPGQLYRVYNEFRLDGNYGVQFGLQDTWGASPLRLARYDALAHSLPKEKLWPLLNVAYVVTWAKRLPVPSTIVYQEAAANGEITYVHRLEQRGQRAWLVHEAEPVGPDQALARIASGDFDIGKQAVVERTPPLLLEPGSESDSVSVTSWQPEQIEVRTVSVSPSLLVLSEVNYPGWRAFVDGKPAQVLTADYVLRAVPLPAGEHTVLLVYRPWTWPVGAAISLISLISLLSLAGAVLGTILPSSILRSTVLPSSRRQRP